MNHLEELVILAMVTIGYVAYQYSPFELHPKRIFGAVIVGFIPAILMAIIFGRGAAELGLAMPAPEKTLLAAAGIFAAVLPTTYLASRNRKMWEIYPPWRLDRWRGDHYSKNALTWAIYLCGYELCFRGYFLFAMVRFVGPEAAVAITTLAYVFAHLPKNAGETIGTIPMGVVFAVAALWTGGFWAPFLAHVFIAVSSDFLMVRARQRATRAESPGDNR